MCRMFFNAVAVDCTVLTFLTFTNILSATQLVPFSFQLLSIKPIRNGINSNTVGMFTILVCFIICIYPLYFKAELKTLQEIASPSFEFAKDLMKHNLVTIQ